MNWESIQLPEYLEPLLPYWRSILRSAVIVFLGLIFAGILSRLLIRPWGKHLAPQNRLVLRKFISYTVFLIVTLMVLREFDFKLTTLLGAAGIAGVAIGFAAQTSLSNIISGIFLLMEKPFQVGDVIKVEGQRGIVESIDLLSLTLRTFDNLSIRIPNETIIKSQLTNVTRHPIRRFDVELGVAYREDVDHVLDVLRDVADRNPHILIEPEPLVAFTSFGESQLNFFVGVWHEKNDFLLMRTTFLRDIKVRFAAEDIEIPYPHRVVVQARDEVLPPEGIVHAPE